MASNVLTAQSPVAEQACNECRRRKSKCDRIVPVCGLCNRFRRLCLYERPSKTPLTRRHLSEVEEELQRTKRLVEELLWTRSNNVHQPNTRVDSYPDNGWQLSGQAVPPPSTSMCDALSHEESQHLRQDDHPNRAPGSTQRRRNSAIELEPLPASLDLDWDERDDQLAQDKFADGMASLSNHSSGGGYLGIASGAAFLRLTGAEGSYDENAYKHPSPVPMFSIPKTLWSLGQLEPFIDAYFRLYHISYPIVHEATFRAQFMEVIPRPQANTWQVLLYTIAALGAFSAATGPTEVDVGLMQAAKSRLSIDMLETGNLTLVQALTLISNYVQKRDKPNSGYNYTGLARRIAMGIGLHKDFGAGKYSPLMLEQRRRAWWVLFIFDIGAIITFSRPLDFPDGGIETELPLNIHDSGVTAATTQLPASVEETTIYSHLRLQSTFHVVTYPIYNKMITTPYPPANEMIELDDTLIEPWLSNLPQYFKEDAVQSERFKLCHSILRCRYRNFRLLMYRPFLVHRVMTRTEDDERFPSVTFGDGDNDPRDLAVARCLENAKCSIELISSIWNDVPHTLMACWYCLYFLFQAVLAPILCLRNRPQSPLAPDWRAQVNVAITVMESMLLFNKSAGRCLGVIRSLCGTFLLASPVDWGNPTEESPATQLHSVYSMMWPNFSENQYDGTQSILQESTIMDFMSQIPEFG